MTTTILEIDPFPKPRMTRQDQLPWVNRPPVVKYFRSVNAINLLAKNIGFKLSTESFGVVFVVPFPKSYSAKKKASLVGQKHQLKPDLDNYMKGLKDALLDEDCTVWEYKYVRKIWGHKGQIIIEQ